MSSTANDVTDHVNRIKADLEEARRRLTRSRLDETDATKRRLLEDNVTEDCQVRLVVTNKFPLNVG